jgi:class 3 adenylate cyclase
MGPRHDDPVTFPEASTRPPQLPEGIVTFLLTDIEGSTPLWETHTAAMSAALARHEALVTEVVASHGGRLIKSRGEGDSTLSVFVRATDAVAAALALQQVLAGELWPEGIALPTRAALHSGEAELRDGDYYGQTLNRAARLRALAEGGHVLLSQGTAELVADQLPAGTSLADVGKYRLKGLSRPEHVFALVHPDLGPPPQLRLAPAASAGGAFVGRDAELAQLDTALDAALGGQGRLVLVAGEPGIGKTRLLQEFAAAARRQGALVLFGRCLEGAWVPPYHPFVEAITGHAAQAGASTLRADLGPAAGPLAQLVPELRELLPDVPTAERLQPDEERLRLLDAVARSLAGLTAHGPVVLVLDDLHWADPSTLMTLRHIARVLVGHRLLLVGSYRSDEAGPELLEALGALRAEAEVTAVHLHSLPADSLRRMLGDLAAAPVSAALADAIQRDTRGNPFFAREVILHLQETQAMQPDAEGALQADLPLAAVPQGLRDVLARRRARLPQDANRFLDTAAAFDGPFPFAIVAEVAALDDDAALAALDEVLDAGLIEADVTPERYQFGHALIRHAVYADLNPSRRLRLHRKLAHALEAAQAAFRTRVTPAEVAAQYHRSAVLPGADAGVAPALEAADQAQAASAHGEAASFLGMACELAPSGDDRLPRLRARLGLALAWALRLDEAVQVARGAAEEIAAAEDRPAAAGYLAEVAAALTNADSAGHGWQLAPPGLAYAGERRDTVWATLTLLDRDRREAADPGIQGSSWTCPSAARRCRFCTAPASWRVASTCSATRSLPTARASASPTRSPRIPPSGCSSSVTTPAPCRASPPRRPRRTPAASSPRKPIAAASWPAAGSRSATWTPAAPRWPRPTPCPTVSRPARGAGSGITPSSVLGLRSRW